MDDAQLLNELFRFKHKRPSDCQDASMCHTLAKWFAAFVEQLEAVEDPPVPCGRLEPLADDRRVSAAVFSVHEVQVLEKVAQRLTATSGKHKRGDVWFDPWLPQYGCVVQRSQLNATIVRMEVVFADGWERALHFVPSGECVHSAIPTTHHILHCVDLDMDIEARFSTAFTSKLREAQRFKGNERSAAKNEVGRQKTPQFIAAVVRQTVNALMENVAGYGTASTAPGGGTTDVGLHTGGRARDTCWAVVQAAIARNLCSEPGLLKKNMIAFKLSVPQMALSEVEMSQSSIKDGCACVNDLFYMLEVIVQSIVELVEGGYDVSLLEKTSAGLRSRIDGFVDVLNGQTATKYVLPNEAELNKVCELDGNFSVTSPKRKNDFHSCETNETRHRRALENLKGCCFLDGNSCTVNELLRWGRSTNFPASYKSILMLRTYEAFMFERALLLCASRQETGDDMYSLEEIQTLVTLYQQVVSSWRTLPRKTSVLDMEQRSCEMLVMWIAFCLVHRQCIKEVPLCAQYNIALDWQNLKVAVLSDKAAIAALQQVAQYIRTWNRSTRGLPLFT
ncbi:hypothetical protein PsorP6_005448 [Peronosclerospora sorghi]|uniref:Uncharacterized protein n=2 Tax=Peronosclerospora sorghi TaxID=230839 RepID=A0ACC0W3H0_9STRA|nr:hypothetical protein PsorP6_005466 [Peronosclerospora sorghi]KAI9913454.1 hypothetical protein PsorP6_005448 [Peronosclerospora sorghi]